MSEGDEPTARGAHHEGPTPVDRAVPTSAPADNSAAHAPSTRAQTTSAAPDDPGTRAQIPTLEPAGPSRASTPTQTPMAAPADPDGPARALTPTAAPASPDGPSTRALTPTAAPASPDGPSTRAQTSTAAPASPDAPSTRALTPGAAPASPDGPSTPAPTPTADAAGPIHHTGAGQTEGVSRPRATGAGALSLGDLYQRRLAEHGFASDAAQLAAVAKLEDLRRRLIAARASNGSTLRRWLARLGGNSPREPERGLYLWGGVGRGKTWLMDLFFESLPFREARRRHFHRFMHDVHVQLKDLQNREAPLELLAAQIARDTRVLCFDELFVTDIADAMILGGLFAGLFKRGVTLVATSNVPPHDLYKNGLQRQRFLPAIDLIEQHVDILNVDGRIDYRLRQLTQAGTYLLSTTPDTPQRLDALFVELADRGASTGGSIEIEGRPIPVVRKSNSAVWFNFFAICAGPRSQDDYIEIAREYQSVIVTGVPILDAPRDNEARRFIALIDELYDRNVNLIVSAAAPPNEIYRGERLAFEFQRTVSRLIEMQSSEYLAREHKP